VSCAFSCAASGESTGYYQRKADAKGKKEEELIDFLENFNVRTVLTAHPTQFYPGSV
jgi:phosphoenolpyruvate carboxylase